MAREKKKKAYARGHQGETLAALYLVMKGYRVLEKRYKTPVGEIDLITQRGDDIVFIEVKARPDFATAAESVTPRQKKRITRAAQYYMASRPEIAENPMRFDVIVYMPPFGLHHLEDAWGL